MNSLCCVVSGHDGSGGYEDSWDAYNVATEYMRMRVRESPNWKIDTNVNSEYQVDTPQ